MYLKIIKIILGIVLVVAGFIGFFLPIIPGIILLFAGLFILGIKRKHIEKWIKKIKS